MESDGSEATSFAGGEGRMINLSCSDAKIARLVYSILILMFVTAIGLAPAMLKDMKYKLFVIFP